ncbi:hypothetical protein ACI6PS_13955, partial [Flavobacterium sp. PLA-1-15]|uniref:hypothetical protein n=1 Tax=Flavobacterium sp. PLA-1-15 TaxID=3380533 RepID=UPI003B80B4B0
LFPDGGFLRGDFCAIRAECFQKHTQVPPTSPDWSGNPFPFFFKKEKIATESGNMDRTDARMFCF